MNAQIEDFKTGWYGVSLGLKKNEIDLFIEALKSLKKCQEGHFHLRSNFEGDGGAGDIEIYIEPDHSIDNLAIDSCRPIFPKDKK